VFNSASASTNTFVTGGTLNGTNLDLTWNTGGSVPSIELSGLTFTGNTSGDCITDLYITNLYGCSPLHIEPSGLNNVYIVENGGNVGIGTTGTTEKLHVSGGDILVEGSNGKFYSDLDNAGVVVAFLSGGTGDLTRFAVTSPTYGGLACGVRGGTDVSFDGYGKQGDGFIYSSEFQNGLNIISEVGGASLDDYIRFYAGQNNGATPANTPDIHIQGSGATRGNVGINTKTPTEKLHVSGGDILVETSNGKFYSDLDATVGAVIKVSGGTNGLVRMFTRAGSGNISVGHRGITEPSFSGYGKQGDGFLYSSGEQNGLNIISQQGTSKDDYIRFYVGQSAGAVPANTPDIHIQGSGATRGNVGIYTKTPTEKLHVEGSVRIVDGTEQNGYVLTSDANGVGSWVASAGGIVTGLTTTGTSGSSTLVGGSLNVPVYVGVDTNFANTDLTLTGNRVHDLSGYTATFKDDTNGQTRLSVENLDSGVNAHPAIGLLGRGPLGVTVSGTLQYGGDSYTGFTSFTDGGSGLLSNALILATGGGSAGSRGHINIGSRRGVDAEVRIFNGSGDFDFNSLRAKFTTTGFTSYQDVYIDNLPSESVLGTDADGKIIAGSGGGGATIDPYQDEGNVTSITWDVSGTSTNYEATLTGDTTLNMTNVRNGDYGTLIVTQDGAGSHTLTFGVGTNKVVNGGGGAPTLTTTAGATDILSFTYNGTNFYWTVGNDYT
jgi:hypothetical protein